jgi:hypothetical protein
MSDRDREPRQWPTPEDTDNDRLIKREVGDNPETDRVRPMPRRENDDDD